MGSPTAAEMTTTENIEEIEIAETLVKAVEPAADKNILFAETI